MLGILIDHYGDKESFTYVFKFDHKHVESATEDIVNHIYRDIQNNKNKSKYLASFVHSSYIRETCSILDHEKGIQKVLELSLDELAEAMYGISFDVNFVENSHITNLG